MNYEKYCAISNTNDCGLIKGNQYIVEKSNTGSVYVYDMQGNYITLCRNDRFDNWSVL
jgi:hypothetical protein